MSLPRKDPNETVYITFDFSNVAVSVESPVITAAVDSGKADANPSAILSGSPIVSGTTVLQLVTGGVAGSNYLLRCSVNVGAETVVNATILPVDYVSPT